MRATTSSKIEATTWTIDRYIYRLAKRVYGVVTGTPRSSLTQSDIGSSKPSWFLRNKSRLRNKDVSKCRIVEGNALDFSQLQEAVTGQDIVYANLSGDLEAMARNIVKAMEETGVKNSYSLVRQVFMMFRIRKHLRGKLCRK